RRAGPGLHGSAGSECQWNLARDGSGVLPVGTKTGGSFVTWRDQSATLGDITFSTRIHNSWASLFRRQAGVVAFTHVHLQRFAILHGGDLKLAVTAIGHKAGGLISDQITAADSLAESIEETVDFPHISRIRRFSAGAVGEHSQHGVGIGVQVKIFRRI